MAASIREKQTGECLASSPASRLARILTAVLKTHCAATLSPAGLARAFLLLLVLPGEMTSGRRPRGFQNPFSLPPSTPVVSCSEGRASFLPLADLFSRQL